MDANPYQSPVQLDAIAPTGRGKSPWALSIAGGLGVVSGLVVFETITLLSYRELPSIGFYLYGPSIWLAPLELVDDTFVRTFRIALSLMGVAYWWILLRPNATHSRWLRVVYIALFHFLSVALYQYAIGFP